LTPDTENESDRDEVEILKPLPILVIDLDTNDEDEIAPLSTSSWEDVVLMDTGEDTKSEMEEVLREIGDINLSWEESRKSISAKRMRVMA
jgi:hypothetical protein